MLTQFSQSHSYVSSLLNTRISAGLPNVIGTLVNDVMHNNNSASGALTKVQTESPVCPRGGEKFVFNTINFNASLCSPIYGNSITVTPLSNSCKYFIKY